VTTRKAPETLTATEREIAGLAAAGLTNQMIAERAFVSRKTVEANLARAYRKLGISSRAQLARALEDHRARSIS
jgi:DNA-binding NarL/FixJ family response regulator